MPRRLTRFVNLTPEYRAAANPKRIRVLAGDIVIADTTHALTLKEASYPAVQYVPRSDANLALMKRTDRVTHCPYKGDAAYYSIEAGGRKAPNAVWTYEKPYPAVSKIESLLVTSLVLTPK